MTDGSALLMSPFYGMAAKGEWQDRREWNFFDGGAHFYGAYECADARFIAIGSIEPQFYKLLLKMGGIDVPEFHGQLDADAWPRLREQLSMLFKKRTRAQWCELMEGSDVCFAPVLSLEEAPYHAHNQARQTFINMNGIPQPAPVPRFSRIPSCASAEIPVAGQYSIQALSSVGMSAQEIEQLVIQGAVHVGTLPGGATA